MTKPELLEILNTDTGDTEMDHIEADKALPAYIDDEDVTKAFELGMKWYA